MQETDCDDDDFYRAESELEAEIELEGPPEPMELTLEAQRWFELLDKTAGVRIPPYGSRVDDETDRNREEVPPIVKLEEDLMLISVLRAMRRIADGIAVEPDVRLPWSDFSVKGSDSA